MEHNGRISYQTVCAAKNGDGTAIEKIIRHYERYISHFAKRRRYDDADGYPREAVLTRNRRKLIDGGVSCCALVCTYDPITACPKGKRMEE